MFSVLVIRLRSLRLLKFFFSGRRRHTISKRDWSSDVCSSDLGTTGCSGTQSDSRPRSSQARARSVTGSALPVTNMRTPMSTRGYLLRVGRPGGLGLLEVFYRLVLEPVRERLVAGLELLAGVAEILPLGLRLLVLG